MVVFGMLGSLQAAAGYQVLSDTYKKMGFNGADITKYVEQVDTAIKKLEKHVATGNVPVEMIEPAVMQGLTFTRDYNAKEKRKLKRSIARHVQELWTGSEVLTAKNYVLEVLLECLQSLWGQDLRDKPYIRDARAQRSQRRWELKRYRGLSVDQIAEKDAAFYSKFDQESDASEDDDYVDYDHDMIEDDQVLAASY